MRELDDSEIEHVTGAMRFGGGGSTCVPIIADIDGDGVEEVLGGILVVGGSIVGTCDPS